MFMAGLKGVGMGPSSFQLFWHLTFLKFTILFKKKFKLLSANPKMVPRLKLFQVYPLA